MSATRAWLRIARRELRGGIGGFWIYLACLALGAWAIAAAGSVTASFSKGLEVQSHMLLGGDAAINISQREATDEERAWMDARGTVSEAGAADMMGRGTASGKVTEVDVRGTDARWPLVGNVRMKPEMPLADALAKRNEVWGVLASQSTLDKLGVRVGERFELSGHPVELRGVLLSEPDRLGDPGAFEPHVLLSLDALREFSELARGRLFRVTYRLLLKPEAAPTFEQDVKDAWGKSGMRYRAPEDSIEGLRDLLDMVNTFMSVIGIAALVAGGVGVAQATASFLETRVESIAALKALGADAGTIRAAYALQLGVLAGLGTAVGMALGAATPALLKAGVGDKIPLPTELGLYPAPLAKAFVLTMLAAVMFAAPALGRARATPPAALFRRQGSEFVGRTPWLERLVAVAAALALAAVAIGTTARPIVTAALLVGAGFAYLVLAFAAWLIKRAARLGSFHVRGYARLALSNLGGPGSLAPVVAPALGLGLALMTLIAVIQSNLLDRIQNTAPANGPSIIFRMIPHDQAADFDALLKSMGVKIDNPKEYRRAPFLLGRVISVDGKEVDEKGFPPEKRWIIRAETGMTFIGKEPEDTDIRSGKWWPVDYSGPLLVSVEESAAKALGVKVGDKLGFRIFGRDIEAGVASIRRVDWTSFGTSLSFVFSPGVLEAAKPAHTAILMTPPNREDAIINAVGARWPTVLSFQLRKTLETAADLFGQVSLVVTALASVVTLAGVLVLFGAFAAAARRRRQDSALLKVFGASRGAILALYAFEFALAGAAAALLGGAMGVIAAHPIVINAFQAKWRFDLWPVLSVGGIAILAAAAGGAMVGWATLSHRPARVLRSA